MNELREAFQAVGQELTVASSNRTFILSAGVLVAGALIYYCGNKDDFETEYRYHEQTEQPKGAYDPYWRRKDAIVVPVGLSIKSVQDNIYSPPGKFNIELQSRKLGEKALEAIHQHNEENAAPRDYARLV